MKLLNLALAAGAAVVGYSLFFARRFLGDSAKVGDSVTVPVTALGVTGQAVAAVSPTALGAVMQVTTADKETLSGPVVGFVLAVNGTVQPLPGAGLASVARSSVLAIDRDGRAVT